MPPVTAPLLADMLRQSMARGDRPLVTVTSNSMAPLLRSGDRVSLEPVTWEKLQPGDIITLATETDLLTHRYWGMTAVSGRRCLLTRGDRLLVFDRPWPVASLIGRVIARHRSGVDLPLTGRTGARLNRRLAWLAAIEWRLLTGQATSQSPPTLPLEKQGKLSVRLIHRAAFIWASIVTRLAGLR